MSIHLLISPYGTVINLTCQIKQNREQRQTRTKKLGSFIRRIRGKAEMAELMTGVLVHTHCVARCYSRSENALGVRKIEKY
jgi:hypothetical protein